MAAGGIAPYHWAITAGALPDGLSLDATSGEITGTPTSIGKFDFVVAVSDSSNPTQSVSSFLSITIQPALNSIVVVPVNPVVLTGGSQQFSATGNYSDASSQDLTSVVVWSSSSPAVAAISVGGVAVGSSPGMTTISASIGGRTGSTALVVQSLLTIPNGSLVGGTVKANYTPLSLTLSAPWTKPSRRVSLENPISSILVSSNGLRQLSS